MLRLIMYRYSTTNQSNIVVINFVYEKLLNFMKDRYYRFVYVVKVDYFDSF